MAEWFLGDAKAFAAFYARHWPRTVGWLKARGLSAQLADEVAQEAYLRLHAHIGSYDRTRPALPWFFTIVRSSLIDFHRREGRVAARARAWGAEVQSSAMRNDDAEDQEAVRRIAIERALEIFSEDQRDLVRARFFEEKSYAALALRSGKSEPALRKMLERILKKMRARMREGK